MEKAYKLLALQEGISNQKAKELIDRGLISSGGKKVLIARGLHDPAAKFKIQKLQKPCIIEETEDFLAIEKPPFTTSEEIVALFPEWILLHRLDKETSGVLLLTKEGDVHNRAKSEFKNERVYKEYIALIEGVFAQECEITKPILTLKGKSAKSKISKDGSRASSKVEPIATEGKRSLVRVIIKTGKTHQIRLHLSSIGHPIIGDSLYGSKVNAARVMLHATKIALMGHEFTSEPPREFRVV